MEKVALKVAYIGTHFHGFQRQPNLKTVEGELLNALKKADMIDNIKNSGYSIAGRTDRGVHALGNVTAFRTSVKVIINNINDLLPPNIRIIGKANVSMGFKPRFAQTRHYRYLIADNNLDLKKMKQTSEMFKGTHNFQNFSKKSERSPIRTIDKILVSKKNNIVVVDIFAESFLWNMVRKIVKVLIMVGNDEIQADKVFNFFDPSLEVGIEPMPAEGLILIDVKYSGVEFEYDSYAKNKFLSYLKEEYKYNKTMAITEEVMIKELENDYLL